MDIVGWLSITTGIVAIFATYHLAYKKGLFDKPRIRFIISGRPDWETLDKSGKIDKNRKVRAMIFLFDLKNNSCDRIRTGIECKIENTSKSWINDIKIVIQFPSRYYNPDNFIIKKNPFISLSIFDHPGSDLVMATYKIKNLEPGIPFEFGLPISFSVSDFYNELDPEHEFFYFKKDKGSVCDAFNYSIIAKNLRKSIGGKIYIMGALNTHYKIFLARENKLLNQLGKNFKEGEMVLEVQKCNSMKLFPADRLSIVQKKETEVLRLTYSKAFGEPVELKFPKQ